MRCSYLVYTMCMIRTCCKLWNRLINFYVRMISSVVCHGNSDKSWSDGVMKCFYGGICDVIWNGFCVNYCNYDFDICESCDCDLDLLCLCLSWWQCLEVDLVQGLLLECHLLWHAGMPDGGILSAQSTAM